jgi:probable phosphomutase (TIGR03848 family)
VATVVLVRHGRTPANSGGLLAGRAPGVHLDDVGRAQAEAVARRLGVLSLARVVSSPLERTIETARVIIRAQAADLRVRRDRGLTECGYGDWTGRALKELVKEPLWRTVQAHPSAVQFPGGESLADVQHRAVATVRRHDGEVAAEHGPHALWVAVSHGDVIKAVVADALGLHLDQFQRIVADPCSVTVIRYTPQRPFVVHLNDHGTDLSRLRPAGKKGRRSMRLSSDAPVGGGAGAGGSTTTGPAQPSA